MTHFTSIDGLAEYAITLLVINPKGFTIQIATGRPLEEGFAVGGHTRHEASEDGLLDLPFVIRDNVDFDQAEKALTSVLEDIQLYSIQGLYDLYLGAWFDGKKTVFDIVTVYESSVAARAVGKSRNQREVAYIENFQFVYSFNLEEEVN